ncbi:MAG: plasminogen-binding N-terminal domain-containing protein [Helicobacteraceae bacterium]|nr:plasminogen-binding N-terminal domain-containing protein [Helicobacteraceae bacterium]
MTRITHLLLALAATAFASAEGRVVSVERNEALIAVKGAKAGMSAIIIYEYDGGETIAAKCAAISADDASARLRCEPFTLYDQDSTPTLTLPIRKGDKAIFAPLGQSAIVIAPNVDRLVRAQSRRLDLDYIHPDLFAHQLAKDDKTSPNAQDFRDFCDRYLVGTIVFALNDGDYIVDCQTLAALEISPVRAQTSQSVFPFFNRLGIKSDRAEAFDAYYKRLISKEF